MTSRDEQETAETKIRRLEAELRRTAEELEQAQRRARAWRRVAAWIHAAHQPHDG